MPIRHLSLSCRDIAICLTAIDFYCAQTKSYREYFPALANSRAHSSPILIFILAIYSILRELIHPFYILYPIHFYLYLHSYIYSSNRISFSVYFCTNVYYIIQSNLFIFIRSYICYIIIYTQTYTYVQISSYSYNHSHI